MKKRTRKQYLSSLKRWSRIQPGYKSRRLMYGKCGSKCFLGTRKSFPICRPNCQVDKGGVMSAYIRAREMARLAKQRSIRKHPVYYYNRIASRARKCLFSKKVR